MEIKFPVHFYRAGHTRANEIINGASAAPECEIGAGGVHGARKCGIATISYGRIARQTIVEEVSRVAGLIHDPIAAEARLGAGAGGLPDIEHQAPARGNSDLA